MTDRGEGAAIRAAVYLRVSTEEQTEGTSLGTQRERCQAYAKARGWDLGPEFSDEGVSGARADRPELDRLLAACRRREVDAVLVAKLDRFGRSNRHLATALGELDDLGIAFASVAEAIDSSTPSGRFLRTLLGGAAEFERDMILERTAAGLRARARAGDWPGGPPPFGYRLEATVPGGRRRLALHEPEAAVLRHAAALIVDDGHSTWTAAEVLNGLGLRPRVAPRWVHNRLRKVLLSPTLGGTWTYRSGEGEIETRVPAVLEPDRHAALLDALKASSTGPRRAEREHQYLLSRGILHGLCGAPLHGIWQSDRTSRAYRCAGARPEARPRCADHAVNADQVEEAVWAEVVGLLSEPKRLLQMADDYLGLRSVEAGTQLEQLATIDEKLATLKQARTGRVAHALRAGVDATVLKSAVEELETQEKVLLAHRARHEAWRGETAANTDRMRRLQEFAASARERLEVMTAEERRAVLELLDVRVTVNGWSTCEACEGRGKVKGGEAVCRVASVVRCGGCLPCAWRASCSTLSTASPSGVRPGGPRCPMREVRSRLGYS